MRGAFIGMDRYSEHPVDACIRIADGNTGSYGNWDIGFVWSAETKKYEVTTDSDLPVFAAKLGVGPGPEAKTIDGAFCRTDTTSRMLGRLSQRYNLLRDEIMAVKAGLMPRRVAGSNGVLCLEVEVR